MELFTSDNSQPFIPTDSIFKLLFIEHLYNVLNTNNGSLIMPQEDYKLIFFDCLKLYNKLLF
jgi:hypothetical protein